MPEHTLVDVDMGIGREYGYRDPYRHLVSSPEPAAASDRTDPPLTPRQLQILQLIADGCTNQRIASRLDLSPGTVKTHVGMLLRRLGARDRANAVAIGYRTGLLSAGR